MVASRRRVSSGTPWESKVGYSRAVRVGAHVHVSGTTATGSDGRPIPTRDPYRQAVQALSNVIDALRALGAGPEDVVRTRFFVTDIRDWEAIGRAHLERFQAAAPATTMVEVQRLIHEDLVVEVEADAWVGPDPEPPPARPAKGPSAPRRRRRR